MANTTGGAAVAERPADSVWLSTLPTPRIAALSGLIPSVRPSAELLRVVHPAAGLLSDLPGPVTDLAVSEDGRFVVAAHYGQGAVSIIDVATLTVASEVDGIAEPYAVAAAGRAYVRSASISEDTVVAVDLETGSVLADREIERSPVLLSFANLPEFGVNATIAPNARPDDGLLDICILSPVKFRNIWIRPLDDKAFVFKPDTASP